MPNGKRYCSPVCSTSCAGLPASTWIEPMGVDGHAGAAVDGHPVDHGGEQAGVALLVGAAQRLARLEGHLRRVRRVLGGEEALRHQGYVGVDHRRSGGCGERRRHQHVGALADGDGRDLEVERSLRELARHVRGDEKGRGQAERAKPDENACQYPTRSRPLRHSLIPFRSDAAAACGGQCMAARPAWRDGHPVSQTLTAEMRDSDRQRRVTAVVSHSAAANRHTGGHREHPSISHRPWSEPCSRAWLCPRARGHAWVRRARCLAHPRRVPDLGRRRAVHRSDLGSIRHGGGGVLRRCPGSCCGARTRSRRTTSRPDRRPRATCSTAPPESCRRTGWSCASCCCSCPAPGRGGRCGWRISAWFRCSSR